MIVIEETCSNQDSMYMLYIAVAYSPAFKTEIRCKGETPEVAIKRLADTIRKLNAQ